jgi:hypothetical protein
MLDLPDAVILQLLEALVSKERITGNDYTDRRVLPEEDAEGNEIFYHGSGDGLRDGKIEPYLYVSPHPMFAVGYSNQANKGRHDPYYDNDTAHKVFKFTVPKGRAIHFNQFTDPFFQELGQEEPEDEYEKLLLRGENPFNYVIDDTTDLVPEEYEITPELIELAREYYEPKELYEQLKQQRNLIDGIKRKY